MESEAIYAEPEAPNTDAVFQSVTEELQEMKHKYQMEMRRVLEDQEQAQEVSFAQCNNMNHPSCHH